MPTRNRELESTLLTWVNSFPDLPKKVRSLADLTDGKVFWQILKDFDSRYADFDLEEITPSTKWLAKKKNLEAIYKSLTRYMNNHCEGSPIALVDPIDFNAIAEHDDARQTIELISIFLVAAVECPQDKRAVYVSRIQNLGGEASAHIGAFLQELLVGRDASKVPDSDDPVLSPKSTNTPILPPKFANDLGLAIEQELAQLHRDHELLRKKGADDITRLETLSSRHETLLEILKERDATIESLRNSNNTEEQADYIKSLLNKLSDGEYTIEAHEAQAEENRVKIAKYERELAKLRPAAIALVEAEDKMKELEIVQEALRKMTNKVHHYEQKLARFSAIEKENVILKEQKRVLESNQKDYDQIHLQNTQMTEENAQYRSAFEAYERTASEAEENQRFLKDTIREKEATIESLNARLAHDERYIAELQESINSHNTGVHSPDSPTGREAGLSLEEELAQSEEQPAPNYDLEISRLKAENQLLKSNTAGTTNATLRVDLENAERLRKRLEVQFQELNEKYAIGQEQLNALISTSAGEKLVKILDSLLGFGPLRILTEGFYRNEAISNTRKLWLDATKELATARSKIADLQTELTDRDRQILAAQADLSAIGSNDINALNELKRVNELITSSLQNDLLILQGQHKALTTDFELQKTQLLEALLAKDRALAEVVNLHEVMSTNEEILLAKAKANERMKEERIRNEHIEEQELMIQDLNKKLKAAEESSPDAQKVKNEALIKNLTHENALIATAWYDLSSRLQSNHVALQRRQDPPKSWLNKQRQMVNVTPRR